MTKFKYRPRSPYVMYMRITEYQLQSVDRFLELTDTARRSEQRSLEKLQAQIADNIPDDWLVDDFAQLKDFSHISTGFAIVGLWRCVELYRKRVLAFTLGGHVDETRYEYKKFVKRLASLSIDEAKIRCSRSANELRCVNNSVKHSGRVDDELAQFRYWRRKEGDELGNLEPHYHRLRPLAEKYLWDLSTRLDRIWERTHNKPLQRTAASGGRRVSTLRAPGGVVSALQAQLYERNIRQN